MRGSLLFRVIESLEHRNSFWDKFRIAWGILMIHELKCCYVENEKKY